MHFRSLIAVVGVGLTLTACADLFTIGRITEIPNKGDSNTARAIHLDAQQRLVLVTAQGYCAEPSPDALASYAASLGFDLDIFNQGSGSLAQVLKNDAASIGLRTQSITLMRDALYRMCEASNNGHLNETEVVAFLRRSQDLTAVVLAIEQLTGAVAAKQVILTPSANAGASANLVSNHQLLDQMEKDVKEKEKAVEEKKKVAEGNKAAAHDAQLKLDNATDSEKKQAEKTFSEAEKQVKTSEEDLKAAKERLKETEKVRDTIKASRDAALTNATVETAGTGQFSPVVQRNQLSGRATEAIATAVQIMVEKVLNKAYTPDVCLSYLINSKKEIEKIEEGVSKAAKKIEEDKEIAIQGFPWLSLLLVKKPKPTQDDINQYAAKKIEGIEGIKKICMEILETSIQTTPEAPTKLNATPGNKEVTLSWTAPSNGGSTITQYQYRQKERTGSFGAWQDIPSSGIGQPNETGYTVKKLTNGTPYTFEVRAKNVAGAGKTASTSTTPAMTPKAPTKLNATPGNKEVTLAWTAPSNGGSTITQYQYRQKEGTGSFGAWQDIPSSGVGENNETRYAVAGLTNGTVYNFKVRATNSVGAGKASESVSATPATTPATPINLQATPGNREVILAWTKPDDGGAAISNYEYRQSLDKRTTWSDWNPISGSGTNTTRHTITGLSNGRPYTFEVRARNAAGAGQTSKSVNATPRTKPAAPTKLNATPGNKEVMLAWTAPSNGGSTITQYQYRQKEKAGSFGAWKDIPSSGVGETNETSYTIIGLSNGTAYTFEVRATNAAGEGEASTSSVTPRTTPAAPINLSATPGNKAVTLAWTPPDAGGSVITKYQYHRKEGTGSFGAWQDIPSSGVGEPNETRYTVTNLTNGTAYTFEVRATNAAGEGEASTSSVTPKND